MITTNIVLYNDTRTALDLLDSALIRFNNQFTGFNKRELEGYINMLDRAKAEFELYYKGPELIKLELLEEIQDARNEAIVAIIEFDQLSTNH